MIKMNIFSMDFRTLIILILTSSRALSQTPWKKVSTSKYELTFYSLTASSFENARSICQNIEADLIQLDDVYVRNKFYEIIPKIYNSEFFWIGAIGTMYNWNWLNGKSVDMNLITWKHGQPDNSWNKENRMIYYAKTDNFGDIPILFQYGIPTCQRKGVETNSIFFQPNSLEISLPSQTTMICAASGYPYPYVKWESNNKNVSTSASNSVYQIQTTGRSALKLEKAKVTDEDKYTCFATNSYEGSTFSQNKQLQVKVPTTPTIDKVTANPCNSSMIIEWKPHHRAIGIPHRFRFLESTNKVNNEIHSTPSDDKIQNITTGNLSSSTQYTITIKPCYDTDICYPYVASKTSTTGGIPDPVTNAVLNMSDGECMVSWDLPKITRPAYITQFKVVVLPLFAQPPVGVNATINRTSIFVGSSILSYIIPKLPNRNYSVTIQAETCAGVGNRAFASGKCVTDAAAPAFVAKAELTENSSISENGTLEITFQSLDETNGPISCIFVILKTIKKVKISEKYSEKYLRKLNENSSKMTDEYIAIVAGPRTFESIRLKNTNPNTLHITLGDENTTECNIRKIGISSQKMRAINNSSEDIFYGSNKRLIHYETYGIKVVTSTPSGNKVLFQESEALAINYIPPPTSQTPGPLDQQENIKVIISSLVAGVGFIALLVMVIVFVRRRHLSIISMEIPSKKSHHTNETHDPSRVYKYPSMRKGQPGIDNILNVPAKTIDESTYEQINDNFSSTCHENAVYDNQENDNPYEMTSPYELITS